MNKGRVFLPSWYFIRQRQQHIASLKLKEGVRSSRQREQSQSWRHLEKLWCSEEKDKRPEEEAPEGGRKPEGLGKKVL